MNKTTTPGVTISAVKRTHAWWLYLWPFQSRRELLQSLAILAVGLPIMGATIGLLDSTASLVPILICSTIGSLLCGAYPLLPACLTLATRSEATHFTADLHARLIKLGYVASDQSLRPGRLHYRSKRSRLWRWDEQDVEMLVYDHELVLNGPFAIMHLLRARLLLPDDYAYLKDV